MLLGTQCVNDAGHLEIGGCDVVDLARRFGTPLYVVDEAFLRDNLRRYKQAFAERYPAETTVYYAAKAFLITAMVRVIDQEGLSLDVASGGELHTALAAGFPPERIILHGNYKSEGELRAALEAGVGRIVVDNFFELRRLNALAAETGRVQPVLIRVTPGIDPHTHRRIRTGQEDTKFGINISDGSALEAIGEALDFPNLNLLGIHCHIGSQLLDSKSHEDAIEVMVAFLAQIRETTGRALEELNIGGGLGVRYLPEHKPPTYEEFADTVCATLKRFLKQYDLEPPRLSQEPGRALVAETGTTLYTIGPTKRVNITEDPGSRTYVSVDGGMSDNPRPQLYDAVYTAMVANRAGQPRDQVVTVAGKHCETDLMITDIALGDTDIGDILAVQSTGAYNHAMASNYNRFPRSTVVFVRDGEADVVYERETLDDLLRQDRIPARLAARAS
uniref:Diaminopimelate decarboxylase n=1 Tax=uncultured Armatimonadetes bacterium TaxID=157466 RepID=A0A6J4HIM1_9BACT|nr:Diaminopimelate decarboxylase [uncultured Armatimonadetes bacterium]